MAMTPQQERVARLWISDRADYGDFDAILVAMVATPQEQIATLKAFAVEKYDEAVLRKDWLAQGATEAADDEAALGTVRA